MARAIVLSRQGEHPEALPPLQRAFGVCQEQQVELLKPWVSMELGHIHALLGRLGDALALLTPALKSLGQRSEFARESLAVVWLADAYLRAGSCSEAMTHAGQALAHARARGERGNEAWALSVLGDTVVHADPPDTDQAESYYCQALALADELSMRPLAAHCHLGLGTLYQRLGHEEPSRAELTTAAEMYRAMEMPFWLARAEAALAGAS